MCKYCEELFTGECNETILEDRLNVCNIDFVGVEVFINDDELELYLDTIPSGETISRKKIKIQYCPFCGRKLEVGSD